MKMTGVEKALEFVQSLTVEEQHAFVALFARTCQNEWILTPTGLITGKRECEIDDWRQFYADRLVKAGLVTYREKIARGVHYVYVTPTKLGTAVRDAWWDIDP